MTITARYSTVATKEKRVYIRGTSNTFPKQVIATTSGDERLSAGINIAVARVGELALLANGKEVAGWSVMRTLWKNKQESIHGMN